MFYSIVYRWTFMQWPFLGCFTTASLVLLFASTSLGVVCRLNFGKGHAEYRKYLTLSTERSPLNKSEQFKQSLLSRRSTSPKNISHEMTGRRPRKRLNQAKSFMFRRAKSSPTPAIHLRIPWSMACPSFPSRMGCASRHRGRLFRYIARRDGFDPSLPRP